MTITDDRKLIPHLLRIHLSQKDLVSYCEGELLSAIVFFNASIRVIASERWPADVSGGDVVHKHREL